MLWEEARRRGPVVARLQQSIFSRQRRSCFRQGPNMIVFFCFCFLVCSFVCNNGYVFAVFCLYIVFQFVNSNNGGGLSTFRINRLSARSES